MAVIKARNSLGNWEIIGKIGDKGPTGPQGDKGPQGDQGPQGFQGATGATGSQGPVGNQGGQGPQGAQGPDHYWQIRYGAVTVTPVANTNTVSSYIAYTAPFRTGPPTVCIVMRSGVPGGTVVNVGVERPTADQFRVYVYRTNTTNVIVDWVAIGER